MKHRNFIFFATVGGVVAALAVAFFVRRCVRDRGEDWPMVREQGTLVAVMETNPLSMWISDGDTVGFYYEAIKAFAARHGLRLAVKESRNLHESVRMVEHGEADVLAYATALTSPLMEKVAATVPLRISYLVLAQHRGDSVNYAEKLKGRLVYVSQGSPAALRLNNLASELGDSIHCKEMRHENTWQLLAKVAAGEVEYTMCERDLAVIASDSFPEIDVALRMGFEQQQVFCVNKHAVELRDSLDAWISSYRESDAYGQLCGRYFGNKEM